MSSLHQRIWAQQKAQREFEENARDLQQDLGTRVPVRWLEVRVRLLEELVEKTGGCLLTESYRGTLSELKKQVVLRAEESRRRGSRSTLHVVRAS